MLLGLDADGKPLWGDWSDIDPRPLWQLEQVGDPKAENLLIKGDNLYALKALERDFAGQIKCIYIDPPFDVGADFSMDIEIGDESFTKKPSVIEEIAEAVFPLNSTLSSCIRAFSP